MWNPFVVDDANYIIKCKKLHLIRVYLTDLKAIWSEECTSDILLDRFQELNPLFDADSLSPEDMLNKILSLIGNIHLESTNVSFTKEDNQIILELKQKWSLFSVHCKFYLSACDQTEFFNEFTLPLIQSVQYLEVRQKKLFDLLEKKDKEIEEHELEGGEISRRSLVTKKFSKEYIVTNTPEQLVLNVFGKSQKFLDTFTNQHGMITNINFQVTEGGESIPKKKKKLVKNSTK